MLITPKTIVTVRVDYFLPDYPSLIEEFCWQTKDDWPNIPRIHNFLNFWHDNIEATISEVFVAHSTEYRWRKVNIYEEY